MIVVVTKTSDEAVVEALTSLAGTQGVLENVVKRGDGCRVLSFRGGDSLVERFETCPEVSRVVVMTGPWGMIGKSGNEGTRGVSVGQVSFGGGQFPVIAGPCSVEGLEQLQSIAQSAKESGAVGLRGGAFKPRTSPYAFQGLGSTGLDYLATAGKNSGLMVVTEVMSPEEVPLVAQSADMLQVGSRNVQNFRLLEAIGRTQTPVLLKRGLMSTVDEFLGAAEYIFMRGNENIVLCERGIRSFEPRMRNTLDLAAVALLKQLTHLPVIVDPSHGTGLSELVGPMSKAAVAVGADGLMIEIHPRPELALSDGRQSLSLEEFGQLMKELAPIAQIMGRSLPGPMTSVAQA